MVHAVGTHQPFRSSSLNLSVTTDHVMIAYAKLKASITMPGIYLGHRRCLVGAHCVNHNKYSIGVCYEGGLNARGQPTDTRTPEQKVALRRLLEILHRHYPKAVIVGHHDLNPMKDCPCIESVTKEYADLQPK